MAQFDPNFEVTRKGKAPKITYSRTSVTFPSPLTLEQKAVRQNDFAWKAGNLSDLYSQVEYEVTLKKDSDLGDATEVVTLKKWEWQTGEYKRLNSLVFRQAYEKGLKAVVSDCTAYVWSRLVELNVIDSNGCFSSYDPFKTDANGLDVAVPFRQYIASYCRILVREYIRKEVQKLEKEVSFSARALDESDESEEAYVPDPSSEVDLGWVLEQEKALALAEKIKAARKAISGNSQSIDFGILLDVLLQHASDSVHIPTASQIRSLYHARTGKWYSVSSFSIALFRLQISDPLRELKRSLHVR